ncbi:hypothetical protein [Streptosporangium subroseum]|nr:hypothetical protein OHB15_14480 [Streptosporangium subroseum]
MRLNAPPGIQAHVAVDEVPATSVLAAYPRFTPMGKASGPA